MVKIAGLIALILGTACVLFVINNRSGALDVSVTIPNGFKGGIHFSDPAPLKRKPSRLKIVVAENGNPVPNTYSIFRDHWSTIEVHDVDGTPIPVAYVDEHHEGRAAWVLNSIKDQSIYLFIGSTTECREFGKKLERDAGWPD